MEREVIMGLRERDGLVQELEQARRELESARKEIRAQHESLRIALLNERLRAEELAATQRQLQAFALDFKRVRRSERERLTQVAQAQEDTLARLLSASRFRDQETGAHIWRVGLYSRMIGRRIGLAEADADLLFRAAQLHDVGKIGVPDAILRKAGKLDRAEWALMREHTSIGAQLLEDSGSVLLEMAHDIALRHHEQWDGSGYPGGLRGESIPLWGRIVKLADTYDALRMERPYKTCFDHKRASAIILEGDGRTSPCHFDPALLDLFRQANRDFDAAFESCRDELDPNSAGHPAPTETPCEKSC
jgi:putative two-component system response regulator